MPLQIKRIYEPSDESDGIRILVDRLWPRGISKERAHLDRWAKELAPSTKLRKWFGHKMENFNEFAVAYQAELDANPEAQKTVQAILADSKKHTITLLYGAKDPKINHAIVLKKYLDTLSRPSTPM